MNKPSSPQLATMVSLFVIFLVLTVFVVIFGKAIPESHSGDIGWWCNKTPHPEPCKYYMSLRNFDGGRTFGVKHISEFRKMVVQVAMERAVTARSGAWGLGEICENDRQKAALSDCVKLYDNTILQLDRILHCLSKSRSCSDFDVQTWLSAALTNIETCLTGGKELHVSDFINGITPANVSELISNGLAINRMMLDFKKRINYSTSEEDGFPAKGQKYPSWVANGDRKLLASSTVTANLVVAKDGSGNFMTVQAAIEAAGKRSGRGRFVIYVKRGIYRENIEVGANNNYIMMVGDGMKKTIITSDRSVGRGFTTYNSATAGIDGLGFIARQITFINQAGPKMGQAVALRSASDLSVFFRCAFYGYQDTLMVLSQRQFYRECYIYGTVDFIFGNAAVVFQKCVIYVKKPLNGQVNVITAQGRNDPNQNTAISIHRSQIRAAPDLKPVVHTFLTYLGRPWMRYSRTVILKTYMDKLVSPLGWLAWQNSSFALSTLYYGEYNNFGPRASTKHRVRWRGFHVITSAQEASRFTVQSLISGQSWLSTAGVPFSAGL